MSTEHLDSGAPEPEGFLAEPEVELSLAADEAEAETQQADTDIDAEEVTPEQQAERHKRSVQDRINKATAKQRDAERRAVAAEQRAAELEAHLHPIQPPNIEDFDDLDDYLQAEREFGAWLGQRQMQQHQQHSQQQSRQQQETVTLLQGYQAQESQLARSLPDYHEVIATADAIIGESGLPVDVSLALLKNPNGARIGYELARDSDTLIDFLNLTPMEQLVRIGELSARLPRKAATPHAADLPKPISPVSGNSTASRDKYKMSDKAFLAAHGLS